MSPAARDVFGPKFNDLSSQTSDSSHARGHGSASGKNFLRPSMTAFPASHSGASGASGQIIVGAALPLRRRGAVGSAPRCGTRALANAIQSREIFMALWLAQHDDVCGTGWVIALALQPCIAPRVLRPLAKTTRLKAIEASLHVSKAVPTPPDPCWSMGQLASHSKCWAEADALRIGASSSNSCCLRIAL